ncbi:hypothetical protein niasHT_036395 [Heterodera trifolii]|uniref:Uncharacterized protein n=1 Tax=Heterodera trifolii TaxID=157864 RepID=A0ABD2I0S4_9BILA
MVQFVPFGDGIFLSSCPFTVGLSTVRLSTSVGLSSMSECPGTQENHIHFLVKVEVEQAKNGTALSRRRVKRFWAVLWDIGKAVVVETVKAVAPKLIDSFLKKDCAELRSDCKCKDGNYGNCVENKGTKSSDCCSANYDFKCCVGGQFQQLPVQTTTTTTIATNTKSQPKVNPEGKTTELPEGLPGWLTTSTKLPEGLPGGLTTSTKLPERLPGGLTTSTKLPEGLPGGLTTSTKLPEGLPGGLTTSTKLPEGLPGGLTKSSKLPEGLPGGLTKSSKLPEGLTSKLPVGIRTNTTGGKSNDVLPCWTEILCSK